MNCPRCRRLVAGNTPFCIYCGAPLAAASPRRWLLPAALVVVGLVTAALVYAFWQLGPGRAGDEAQAPPAAVDTLPPPPTLPAGAPPAGDTPTLPAGEPAPTKTPAPTAPPTATASVAQPAEIVFQSNRDGDFDIYIMSLDGSNQRPLTVNNVDDSNPRVSPDGRRIAFQSDRAGSDDIYVMARDGSGQTRLTTSADHERQPTWSPDGTQLLFYLYDTRSSDLYVIDADGGNLRQVTATPYREGHSAWSAGGRIVYNVTLDERYQIVANNLSGTAEQRLTNTPGDDWSPEWSPDGRSIIFLSERAGTNRDPAIFIMNADGSGQRLLYDSLEYEWSPSWSADGAHILFTMVDGASANARDDIYIMNADGSSAHLVAQSGSYPSWAAPLP